MRVDGVHLEKHPRAWTLNVVGALSSLKPIPDRNQKSPYEPDESIPMKNILYQTLFYAALIVCVVLFFSILVDLITIVLACLLIAAIGVALNYLFYRR